METKLCSGYCKKERPLSSFHRDSSRRDGLRRWCKTCATITHLIHREERLISMRVAAAKQKAKRYGVPSTLTTDELVSRLIDSKYLCELCGSAWEQMHHVQPMSKGGPNSVENITLLCKPCHKAQHTKPRKAL